MLAATLSFEKLKPAQTVTVLALYVPVACMYQVFGKIYSKAVSK